MLGAHNLAVGGPRPLRSRTGTLFASGCSVRIWLVFVLFVFAAVACDEQKPPGSPPAPPKARPRDAAATKAVTDAGTREISELAGTWRGDRDVPEYGHVVAVVTVSEAGTVIYQVVGKVVPMHLQFRIEAWDGKRLSVRDNAGNDYQLPASLSEDVLDISAPGIGTVRLTRVQAKR